MSSALDSSLHFSSPSYHRSPTVHSSGGWASGVEGFIGHLAIDVKNAAFGLPTGLLHIMTTIADHPISGTELIATEMAKTTWHDWSPLFHGDFKTWERQFVAHPLAPILDVVGFATFGAGTAARGAGFAAKFAEATAGTEAAKLAARTGKLAKFANPAKAAHAQHMADFGKTIEGAKSLARVSKLKNLKQFSLEELMAEHNLKAAEYANKMLATDSKAGRIAMHEGLGIKINRAYSQNPLIRLREKGVAKVGNKIAKAAGDKTIAGKKVTDVIGDAAIARRWARQEHSRQSAAHVNDMARTLGGLRKMGQWLSTKTTREIFTAVEGHMHDGLLSQSIEAQVSKPVRAAFPAGQAGHTAFTAAEDAYKKQLQDLKDEGWLFATHPSVIDKTSKASQAVHKALNENTDAGLQTALEHWRKTVTHSPTEGIEKAIQGSEPGTFLMVHGKGAKAWGEEFLNSSKAAKILYTHPTNVWKWLVLGLSPRYFVNNVVGNTLMLAMSGNPVDMVRAVNMHVTMTRGQKTADKEWESTRMTAAGTNKAAQAQAREDIATRRAQNAASVRNASEHIGQSARQHKAVEIEQRGIRSVPGAGGKAKYAMSNYNLFKITHIMSDTYHRDVSANYNIMRTIEYQSLYTNAKKAGKSGYEANTIAYHGALKSPKVREFVRKNVNHTLGQYHSFNAAEKAIQGIVPFYSWNRAITRHTIDMVQTRPYQAAMLQTIGQRGYDMNQQILGNMPEFLQNVVPTSMLAKVGLQGAAEFFTGKKGGRKGIFTTAGLNPYSTIGEEVNAAKSLIGGAPPQMSGDSVGSMMNPVFQGLMETVSGRDLSTGAPVTPTGGILGVYLGPAQGLPQARIAERLLQHYGMNGGYPHAADGNSFLFDKNLLAELSSFSGIPARNLDTSKAADLYRKQEGLKKKTAPSLPKIDFTGRNSGLSSSLDFKNQPAY